MTRVVLAVVLAGSAAACRVDSEIGSNLLVGDAATDAPLPSCGNSIDDDGDALTDFPFDPGCTDWRDLDETDPPTPPACWNDADDDGDGVADFPLELGCESAADDDETDPPTRPECADGIDNDNNNDIDYPADNGCYAAGDRSENTVTN